MGDRLRCPHCGVREFVEVRDHEQRLVQSVYRLHPRQGSPWRYSVDYADDIERGDWDDGFWCEGCGEPLTLDDLE